MREISRTLRCCLKPNASLPHLFFLRTMAFKVFVKGLAFSTTEEKLAEAFSEFGNVLKADIILNAKKRSKGFGYVTFANKEDARRAQIGMNKKILHGRILYVDLQPPEREEKSLSGDG